MRRKIKMKYTIKDALEEQIKISGLMKNRRLVVTNYEDAVILGLPYKKEVVN
jgi:hypothetical protein